ncbi:hypothetical protein [Streptococcus zalophi]|uniref:DUF2975 domain-containing protein n=1 Tax=Streptococcus zalophi TaxID=640031 RepID=A0A934UE31_9STRE|nr:hypothetical protein [Streptococcus zalophi]MBJ8350298.1 hypothetical protein [Streptococcus zalophi]MCR8968273.1 hypothetical protein [Streptococcus zalophi]
MKTTKLTALVKGFITLAATIAIVILSIISIASLVLLFGQVDLTQLLPAGVETTFSAQNAWGGPNAYVLTLVAGNTLMTYGLIKLKQFITSFNPSELISEKTALFLQKGALLMAVVGLIQGITEFTANPNHIIVNLGIAVWLLIASKVITYIKNHTKQQA